MSPKIQAKFYVWQVMNITVWLLAHWCEEGESLWFSCWKVFFFFVCAHGNSIASCSKISPQTWMLFHEWLMYFHVSSFSANNGETSNYLTNTLRLFLFPFVLLQLWTFVAYFALRCILWFLGNASDVGSLANGMLSKTELIFKVQKSDE